MRPWMGDYAVCSFYHAAPPMVVGLIWTVNRDDGHDENFLPRHMTRTPLSRRIIIKWHWIMASIPKWHADTRGMRFTVFLSLCWRRMPIGDRRTLPEWVKSENSPLRTPYPVGANSVADNNSEHSWFISRSCHNSIKHLENYQHYGRGENQKMKLFY